MTDSERLKKIEKKLDTILEMLEKSGLCKRHISLENCPMLYAYLDTWLNEVKAPKIKSKSLAVLRSGVNYYIKPQIADKPLWQVRTYEMLQAIENCPHSYMRQVVYSILRAVFKRAYQYDLIEENPAEKMDFVKHTRKKGRALTHDEQAAFLKAIEEEPTRPLWLFYLYSGCRRQEALTLLWQDIDYKEGRVFIRGTKTENAERYIPLYPELIALFASLPHTDERVFPYTFRSVQWQFDRIRKEHGFDFRIHDLRHTYATRCLESGITTKTVAKWLGHKHSATTDEIYSHLLTEFERQEVAKFKPS